MRLITTALIRRGAFAGGVVCAAAAVATPFVADDHAGGLLLALIPAGGSVMMFRDYASLRGVRDLDRASHD